MTHNQLHNEITRLHAVRPQTPRTLDLVDLLYRLGNAEQLAVQLRAPDA